MRVLVLEPDLVVGARLNRQLLRAGGATLIVDTAISLAAGLEILRSRPIDIVVSALDLPDAAGSAVVRALLAEDEALPIVLAVERSKQDDMLESLGEGAEDFIDKGLRDGELMLRTMRYAIERKSAARHLAYLAHHDRLTGLANRELLRDRLQQAMIRMERAGRMTAVLVLDLDRFKSINDTLGHGAGDELLIAVAFRLKSCVRRMDTIARVGSDEFAVVVEDVEEEADIDAVCAKILSGLAEPLQVRGQELFITASIGIAFCPLDGWDVSELLRNADTAMFRAKTAGGGHACRYTAELNVALNESMQLETALRHALAENALYVCYQPKLSLQTGRLVGVEALLRWQHPEFGLVPPTRFIPLAEETGLIVSIGEWVLRQVCADMRRWEALGFEEFSVAVNLSPRQFRHGEFSTLVQSVLEETAVDPNQLVFEITENLLMEDTEVSRIQLDALKGMGVMVYLDDFGTGYSSLAYLKRFHIDGLKIDRSFIHDIPGNGDEEAVTRAVIALGRALHLGVVAEGVETQVQLDFLLREGCDEVQGFLFSQPLTFDDFVSWLAGSARGDWRTRVAVG